MSLPTDAKARKNVPLFRGLFLYFPDALCEVAELSRIGNEQHNPGEPMHWAKEKSTDEGDCILRHQMDVGTRDTDNVRHATKVAWRALAQLQREIEAERHVPQYITPIANVPTHIEANATITLDVGGGPKPLWRQATCSVCRLIGEVAADGVCFNCDKGY